MTSVRTAPGTKAEPGRGRRRWPLIVALALLLVGGFALRMVRITQPPLAFHPTRQYHSALLTRKYVAALGGYSDAHQALARAAAPKEIELPIMEATTAVVWRVAGHDYLEAPRILSALVWMVGAVLLFGLLRRLTASTVGGLAAVAIWVFQPFAVQASRGFQPEPLMMAALIGALFALVVDDDERSRRSWWIAAAAMGFAGLVKAPALFFVLPVLLVLVWRRDGFRGLFRGRSIGLAVAAVAPAVVYLGLGTALGFLEGQEGGRFLPGLIKTSEYWHGWSSIVAHNYGWLLCGLALLGIALVGGRSRAIGLALLGGYAAFGLVFTYHYMTHDYYHLPLIAVLSLGVGFLVARVDRFVREADRSPLAIGGAVVVGLACVAGLATSRTRWIPPANDEAVAYPEEFVPKEIGEVVDHSSRVIFDSPSWGFTLEYYGYLAGKRYPTVVDIAYDDLQGKARRDPDVIIADLSEQLGGADFFVVTDWGDYEVSPGLSWLLVDYPIVARGDGWIVFDLRHPKGG